MRAQFVLAEIGTGLRRNLTMTVSVIITVAISLALFGAGLLIRAQAETMKDYWYDKVEVSVYLCGDNSEVASCAAGAVTPAQKAQIEEDLKKMPQVERVFYESQEEAFLRFKEQFADSAIADNVTADALPESFRVKLRDPTQFAVIDSAFDGRPGVETVQDQRALLERFFKVLSAVQAFALGIAVTMIVVAVLLISNTIRVAAFSRRRETGIMRLVGASNLYIQLPFLLEGAIAGLIGALLASGVLAAIQWFFIEQRLRPSFPITNFIGWDDVAAVVPIIVVTGVLLAALASFFTLRRYLKV